MTGALRKNEYEDDDEHLILLEPRTQLALLACLLLFGDLFLAFWRFISSSPSVAWFTRACLRFGEDLLKICLEICLAEQISFYWTYLHGFVWDLEKICWRFTWRFVELDRFALVDTFAWRNILLCFLIVFVFVFCAKYSENHKHTFISSIFIFKINVMIIIYTRAHFMLYQHPTIISLLVLE